MTSVTWHGGENHRLYVLHFGDNGIPKVEKFIMLCSNLPLRIYESLKTLCCLAKAGGPLQAHEIVSASNLPLREEVFEASAGRLLIGLGGFLGRE